MMQQGIQALPTARAPGQAQSPGTGSNIPAVAAMFNKPKSGVGSRLFPTVAELADKFDVQQLTAMFNDPSAQNKINILAAITERGKRDAIERGAAGQQAIAQAAQQSGRTVTDDVFASLQSQQAPQSETPTTYAADGGAMHVQHFENGPDKDGVRADSTIAEILRKGPYERTAEDNAKLEAAGYKLQRRGLGMTPEAKADLEGIGKALAAPFGADAAKWLVGAPGSSRWSDTTASAPSPTPAVGRGAERPFQPYGGIATPSPKFKAAPPDNRGVVGSGGAAPAAASAARPVPTDAYATLQSDLKELQGQIPTGLLPEELATRAAELAAQKAVEGRLAAREKEPVTPEVLAARKGLADLATRRQTAQDQRIADYNKRAEDALQAELSRSRQGLLDWDYGRLGTLASSLSGANPKGSFGANLGKGLAAVSTAEQQRMDAARKEYEERQTTVRAMQDARDQIETLELQRQEAIAKGDMEAVRGIQDKIDAIQAAVAGIQGKYATAARTAKTTGLQSLADVLGKRGTLQSQADQSRAQQTSAQAALIQAGKPTEAQFMRSWFEKDPEGFGRFRRAMEESRTEGSIAKSLLQEAIKNPTMLGIMKDTAPELYQLMQREIANQSVVGATPTGPVRQ